MIIWFDMDGVLADFDGEFARLSGQTWKENIHETWKDKWAIINQHPEFFLNLPWIEGSRELWDWCEGRDRRILSASSCNCPASYQQKLSWCERELGISGDPVVIVKHREEKAAYAIRNAVLIDDKEENINEWRAAGGIGVLFENAEQAFAELRRIVDRWHES